MEKSKRYDLTRFSPEVLQEASNVLMERINPRRGKKVSYALSVQVDDSKWEHDSVEEFFADYRRSSGDANYWIYIDGTDVYISVYYYTSYNSYTRISVKAPTRVDIESVFAVFEKFADISRMPEPPIPPPPPPEKPKIFIGHGNSPIWRDLKDQLQDKHDFEVIAYEVGARAGHEIRDILEDMLNKSSFAILVLTAEDETKKGEFYPRLNVVHELGLFQGHLGFSRSIALLEEGTQDFSNINGVQQIRFSKGNIKETFGDVLATLHREFPDGIT